MNILITTFSFPSLKTNDYDGKFVLAEAIAYAENGAYVKVLTPNYKGAVQYENIPPGIEVIRFNYFWPSGWQCLKQAGKPIYSNKSLLAIIQIPFILISFSIAILNQAKWTDIIHAQWTVTALLALLSKPIHKTKIVVTARGSDMRILPVWLNRFIFRHIDGAIDCFGPQPLLTKYKRLFPARYLKLPLIVDYHPGHKMPSDMETIVGSGSNKFIILYIGRFVALKLQRKNLFMDLIAAAPLMKGKIDFHIFFIGGGEKNILEDMKKRIKAKKVTDCVTMLGPKINVADYLHWIHLGLGGEALNAVSQEFILAGIPQIMMSGKENVDSIWTAGRNILLVEHSCPEKLADSIIKMVKSQELFTRIKKYSSIDMCTYVTTTKNGGKEYLRAFRKVIDGNISSD